MRAVSSKGTKPRDEAAVAQIRAELRAGRYREARAILARVGLDLLPDPRRVIAEAPSPPAFRRTVFICGLHRSGTSLLEHHLTAGYRVARLRARVPENEGQFLQDVFPSERPYGGPGHFAFYAQMALKAVEDPRTAREMRKRILRTWAPWVEGDADVLIEKSPPNLTRIPFLRSVFPGSRFVVWTRDPRAVAGATRTKWAWARLPQLMLHWNAAYMTAIEALEGDCLIASYEAFCEDPAGTLREIADFCGLERRTPPLPVAPRFAEIKNVNGKYLEMFPSYRNRSSIYAWDLLGYEV
jgi:hypothetical protein